MSLVAAPEFLTLVKIVFYPASIKYFLSLLFSSAIAKKVLSGDAVFLTITASLSLNDDGLINHSTSDNYFFSFNLSFLNFLFK